MAVTREFRETIYARAQRDPAFVKALLSEAVNAYLGGDEATGKLILRDLINATIGFEGLAAADQEAQQEPTPDAWIARKPERRQFLRRPSRAPAQSGGEAEGAGSMTAGTTFQAGA